MEHTKHTNRSAVIFPKLPPQALVKAADTIIRICRRLPIWNPVEEVSVVGTLLPHTLHLHRARLEIPKVLLSEPWLLVHLYTLPAKWRWGRLVRGQGGQDAFGSLPRTPVRRGEEVKGVISAEEGAETSSCVEGLRPAFGGELHAVVGDGLVDIPVF